MRRCRFTTSYCEFQEAYKTIRKIACKQTGLSEEEFDEVLDAREMT